MSSKKKSFVSPRYAKSEGYAQQLQEIIVDGVCPFCPENISRYHQNPNLQIEDNWSISEADWPYKNTRHHFMLIPREHKTNFTDLTEADFCAIRKLVNWAIKRYRIRGGGLALRFGDSSFTGATVTHLHFHLIIPQLNKKTKFAKVVNFPIG